MPSVNVYISASNSTQVVNTQPITDYIHSTASVQNGTTQTVNFTLQQTVLDTGNGEPDIYMIVSTTIKQIGGSAFPNFLVRAATDVPPAGTASNSFTDLCNEYINYFETQIAN